MIREEHLISTQSSANSPLWLILWLQLMLTPLIFPPFLKRWSDFIYYWLSLCFENGVTVTKTWIQKRDLCNRHIQRGAHLTTNVIFCLQLFHIYNEKLSRCFFPSFVCPPSGRALRLVCSRCLQPTHHTYCSTHIFTYLNGIFSLRLDLHWHWEQCPLLLNSSLFTILASCLLCV